MAETQQVTKKEKLWSLNFFIIWQGQLISSFGDVVYSIALGFWVLAVTGSTGLMGALMAASTLPRVIIGPFAGVIVDRVDRKKILVLADLIRGLFIIFVGVAALMGFIKLWMVFTAGMIIGICGAFFTPAVNSAIPDMVPKSKLIKANSALDIVYTGTSIIGNSGGGFLFQILGAPIMFLFNGLSYLFSVASIIFVKIPKIEHKQVDFSFKEDLKEGFRFIWKFKGLRYFILLAAVLNFFANMAIMLFLPLFQKTPSLGPGKYGIAMAVVTGGVLIGMLFTSIVNIAPDKRFAWLMLSNYVFCISAAIVPLTNIFPLMLGLLLIGGFFNAIVNVLFGSVVQITVPQDMRGKVMGFMGTITMGLMPISMAIGGVLGEFISIRVIIFVCFALCLAMFVPFSILKNTGFREFMNFDPEKQSLEDIL